jgi:Phage related hypothetical protein (DUF1799)
VADDIAVLGVDAAATGAWLQAGEDDGDVADEADEDDDADSGVDFLVWPENWPAVVFFLKLQTQWVWTMGACTGLDYARVEAAMRMYRIARAQQAAMMDDLRVMELAALPLINAND